MEQLQDNGVVQEFLKLLIAFAFLLSPYGLTGLVALIAVWA